MVKLRIEKNRKGFTEDAFPVSPPHGRNRVLRKMVEYGLLGLIIFSPLPAASVNEWSILVIQLTVLAMTVAYFLMERKPAINPHLSRSLKWPGYAFAAMFLFISFQIIPLPRFLVRFLSPNSFSFQEQFSPSFAGTKFLSLSLVPSHTFLEALELLTYVLVGFLIVKTFTRRSQIKRLLTVLVVMGTFQAFYGLFELFRSNPRILFYKKIYNLDSATGTFVNRNHFSGYLEMIIPLAIGLIIARSDVFALGGRKWKEKFLHLTSKGTSASLLLILAVIIMALGIILSRSRSGIFLLVFAFILFVELAVLYFRRTGFRQIWIKNFLGVTFLLITLIALYIGIGATIGRFALDKLLQEGRPLYWNNVASIIEDFPIVGTGLGTFSAVYQAYEKNGQDLLLVHAHNDYLEYLSELGLAGAVLLFGGMLFMVISAFLTWKGRRNPEVKGLAMGGIVSVVVMMIHSITDFNLQIPANMLLFSVVLSLTYVTAYYRKS